MMLELTPGVQNVIEQMPHNGNNKSCVVTVQLDVLAMIMLAFEVVIDCIERIPFLAAWAHVAAHLPLDHHGNCVDFEGSLVGLEASESLVVVNFGNDAGVFHSLGNIDNDPNTLIDGALMLVPHVDCVRKKSANGRLSVKAVSSGCNFLWSRHQHGGNNGSMHSSP